ncbi:MFS transporter [Ethanoligenens sp.]|uniref:MFS transporter n=1 Tax=Ethanoligenens sp. TaxID=2099655 RepID=UPI0039ED01C0
MQELRASLSAKKRWIRIVPIAFITYSLAYLDRSNFGSAVAGGMTSSLHITAAATSLLSSLFFFGYFFFQIPGAMYAEKRSPKKLVFVCLIIWGVLASATGIVNNVKYLYVIRFFLGIVESAIMPTMLIFLSSWFSKSERSKANSFLMLGNPVTIMWMSVVSGYLLDSFGWKNMFIIEGIPPIVWAIVWWIVVKDKPSQAKWLTHAEKTELDMVLREEQKEIPPVKNYMAAFKKPQVIALSLQFFFWSIGVYGFVMWLPSILKNSSKMGITNIGWLSALPYLIGTIMMVTASYFSDKTMKRKVFVWVPLLVGGIAFYLSFRVGSSNFWLSYVLLCIAGGAIYTPNGTFFALITDLLPKNVAGVATALINSMGALGSFVGSYFVGYLDGATGSPAASFLLMAGSLIVAVVLMFFVHKDKVTLIGKTKENPVLANAAAIK